MGKCPETPSSVSNLSVMVPPPTPHHHRLLGHKESTIEALSLFFLRHQLHTQSMLLFEMLSKL